MERLASPRQVKPYFDSESYHAVVPRDSEVAALHAEFMRAVCRVFHGQSGPAPDVVTGHRQGTVMGSDGVEKHKVSFRAWVQNYCIEYTLIKDAIIAAGVSRAFDCTVYKAGEQLLGCI